MVLALFNPSTKSTEAAKAFIADVRERQKRSGKNVKGMISVSEDRRAAVDEAISKFSSCEKFRAREADPPVSDLLLRFEELCRRLEISMPDDVDHFLVYAILADELTENARIFCREVNKGSLSRLVPVTIYHGTDLKYISEEAEFQGLGNKWGALSRALIAHPLDPRAYLRRLLDSPGMNMQ